MRAKIAFGRRVAIRIDKQRIIGTGLHTRLAADAAIGIEIDNAIFPTIEGRDGADRHARRVIAVIAPHHAEQPATVRKLALLDVLDPRAIDAERHLMLALTSYRTCVTSNALAVINEKAERGHRAS